MRNNSLRDRLLSAAEDDWVGVWELASMASSVGGVARSSEVLDLVLSALRGALEEGLIEIGDVSDDGFRSWGLAPGESCGRIEREWRQFPNGPRLGDMSCWIDLTAKGKDLLDSQNRPRSLA